MSVDSSKIFERLFCKHDYKFISYEIIQRKIFDKEHEYYIIHRYIRNFYVCEKCGSKKSEEKRICLNKVRLRENNEPYNIEETYTWKKLQPPDNPEILRAKLERTKRKNKK